MTNPAALQRHWLRGKREQDSIECTSLGEKWLASTSTSALHSSECRGDDRPGSFAKRAKIPCKEKAGGGNSTSEASLRLSSQSQRRQYVLSHETLGERNYRLYFKSVYTYSMKTDAAATSIRWSQETMAEKTARNTAKAAAMSIRRSQEYMAEKTACHAVDATATSAARVSESSPKKRTRRQRNAISTSAARAVEGPTQRLERLQTVNQRHHAQRGLCSPTKQFWFKLAFNYEPVLRLSGHKDLQTGSMSVVWALQCQKMT
ncbi:unnamed protein product [Acanthosepion pharaonis]|uniref:Uncharacterized protein n=1 Tax=Acanthosepion pharaonis TaxID=158019 RepID=A0A812D1W9_ACAPH|nr:unnamed protein product [Sepia pharaonis]